MAVVRHGAHHAASEPDAAVPDLRLRLFSVFSKAAGFGGEAGDGLVLPLGGAPGRVVESLPIDQGEKSLRFHGPSCSNKSRKPS